LAEYFVIFDDRDEDCFNVLQKLRTHVKNSVRRKTYFWRANFFFALSPSFSDSRGSAL